MNLRDLEYLVALAEYRHFRRAAEACNVSQPTLSGQIKKLEGILGVTLLERTSRRVFFTQTGLLLVGQAQRVLSELKILKEMASQQTNEMSGPLHISLIPTIAPYLLPRIIPMLHILYPSLEMYLHEARTHEILFALENGKIDCAILASVKEAEVFIELPLYNEKMVLAVHKGHFMEGRGIVTMEDLIGEKMLMLEDGHCLREQTKDYCFKAGAVEDEHFRATSLETLRNMVSAGSGITLLPELAVPRELERDGVFYIPFQPPEPERQVVLVYRPGSPLRYRYEKIASKIREYMQPA